MLFDKDIVTGTPADHINELKRITFMIFYISFISNYWIFIYFFFYIFI